MELQIQLAMAKIRNLSLGGWGDDSLYQVLAVQAEGPGFRAPAPMSNTEHAESPQKSVRKDCRSQRS